MDGSTTGRARGSRTRRWSARSSGCAMNHNSIPEDASMTADQLIAGAPSAPKAAAPWRSLEEVKQELMRRAGRLSPFEDIRREDAQQVVDALVSLDRDLWAQLWSKLGLAYEA